MNIDDVIDEVRLDQGVSQKSGKSYKFVAIKLSNGYETKVFLHPAEISVIEGLLKGAK